MISHRSRSGVALVMALLILVVLGIIVPSVLFLQQKESKDTVSSGKKTTALQLAEAGQDRGSWKLRESDDIWDDATSGTAISGYNNDVTYTDVHGGEYKVLISSGPGLGQVTVVAKGRATGSEDVRGIEAVYGKGNSIGAMTVTGAIQYKPNLKIIWGPVVTFSSITQSRADKHPRMFSAGSITGRDTVDDSNNGAMPSGNWAAYDYVAFYDLGTAPTVDLEYYKAKAKASQVLPILKKGTGSGNASPWNSGGFSSGYYPATAIGGSSGNPNGVKMEKGTGSGNYSFVCSTCVIYIEGALKRWPSGTWVNAEAVIVTGTTDFNGGGNNYTATVPTSAQDEYQFSPDAVNYWTAGGWTAGSTTNLTDIGFHGFLYSGGDIGNAGGGSKMVGAVFVNGAVTTNTMTVYYDSAVTSNVQFSNAAITRSSWDEVRVSW